ncbi:hypothetical protein GZ77_01515 [Endozoicomonas montiporae]|uniref:Uncharacterized protein n=2 Tax=Endozoicomonas montiporae TaxID=1027273 RepID=A0A081NA83_9GAMM|nr:hypothetical protein EZMO1_2918 [Endozoicomonas montiporae CL-33]KEQ15356.1 hypothetical protein GZ77_01515 [Endozoicomonas montiporae]
MVYREAERIRSAENTLSREPFNQFAGDVQDWKKIVWTSSSVQPSETEVKCRLRHPEQGCQQMRVFAW